MRAEKINGKWFIRIYFDDINQGPTSSSAIDTHVT